MGTKTIQASNVKAMGFRQDMNDMFDSDYRISREDAERLTSEVKKINLDDFVLSIRGFMYENKEMSLYALISAPETSSLTFEIPIKDVIKAATIARRLEYGGELIRTSVYGSIFEI